MGVNGCACDGWRGKDEPYLTIHDGTSEQIGWRLPCIP